MAWKFVGKEDGQGYPGMPFVDLSDEEMADAVRDLEPMFKATHGTIAESKLWKSDAVAPVKETTNGDVS